MKLILLVLLVGCAHKPVEVKKIFELVKENKTEVAMEMIQSSGKLKSYKGYDGRSYSGPREGLERYITIEGLISSYNKSMEDCRDVLDSILKIGINYKQKLNDKKEYFERHCSLDKGLLDIKKIKIISSIDLSEKFMHMIQKYEDRVSSLDSELKQSEYRVKTRQDIEYTKEVEASKKASRELSKWNKKLNDLKCRYLSTFEVLGKLDENKYEISYIYEGLSYRKYGGSHILRVYSKSYGGTGRQHNVYAKYIGKESTKLNNGFTQKVPVFVEDKECETEIKKFLEATK